MKPPLSVTGEGCRSADLIAHIPQPHSRPAGQAFVGLSVLGLPSAPRATNHQRLTAPLGTAQQGRSWRGGPSEILRPRVVRIEGSSRAVSNHRRGPFETPGLGLRPRSAAAPLRLGFARSRLLRATGTHVLWARERKNGRRLWVVTRTGEGATLQGPHRSILLGVRLV
jgi:hypothetical protein